MLLTYFNPINNQQEVLKLSYPFVDYLFFKRIHPYNTDSDLTNILDNILANLDCTIEYNCGRLMMTAYPVYSNKLSDYYFYLSRITNPYIYNEYIDKLIRRHVDNLIFEHLNPYTPPSSKKKSSSKKKPLPPNVWVKHVSHDLFSGKENYIYYNLRTKKEITSDNPDLLEELNAPKKKESKKSTKTKTAGVPMSAMTFSFKKK